MTQISMTLGEPSQIAWSFPFLIVLSGCGAAPECDTIETRNAVLQVVSNDRNNALARYAANNSSAAREAGNATSPENTKPLYQLGEEMVTRSVSKDKRTLTCSGAISATVGDATASKDVNFTVQHSPDGKLSVSVEPFQFEVPPAGAR